jgi:hypothetical protein
VNRPRVEEWSLLALAILVALTFLQAEGSPDIPIWLDWIRRCLRLGLVDGYADIKIDYPPLSLAILYGVALVSRAVGVAGVFGLKVSLLLALLATAFVYGRLSRSVPRATGLLVVLIPCSVGLGYLDVYYAPLLLLAFGSLQQDKWGRFGALFSTACLVKWQPLVLAPFCLVYLWKRGKRAAATALGAAAIPVAALFLFFGPEMFRALGRALSHRPLSANALNLWWLVTHALRAAWPEAFGGLHAGTAHRIYGTPGLGPQMLALRLPFVVGYAAVFVSLWRREPRFPVLVRHALVGFLTYFMLATGVHENHLFVVVMLGAVLALCDDDGSRTFLVWASVFNVNLWVFYGASGLLPMSRVLAIDLALPLAALNLWLFALALAALLDEPP